MEQLRSLSKNKYDTLGKSAEVLAQAALGLVSVADAMQSDSRPDLYQFTDSAVIVTDPHLTSAFQQCGAALLGVEELRRHIRSLLPDEADIGNPARLAEMREATLRVVSFDKPLLFRSRALYSLPTAPTKLFKFYVHRAANGALSQGVYRLDIQGDGAVRADSGSISRCPPFSRFTVTTQRELTSPDRARLRDAIAARTGRQHTPVAVPQFRELSRKDGRYLGQLVRDGDLLGASEFVSRFPVDASKIAAALSRTTGMMVERAYCGHFEASRHVLRGAAGATVCRHCVEVGRFIQPEDREELYFVEDLYEHEDGLYYTYPEPDGSELLQSYSMNVTQQVKMDNTFKSTSYGDFHMGIELEVYSSERNRALSHTHKELCKNYAVMKSDGSLSSSKGFEIVTAPRRLAEHLERFSAWKPHESMTAWDAGVCGMHVHISSAAFTPLTLGKFLEFWNAPENASFLREITGRHPSHDSQAQSYSKMDRYVKAGNPRATLANKSEERYHIINTNNLTSDESRRLQVPSGNTKRYNTLEIRLFRATLNKKRLLAQFEFAHASVMFCRQASMAALRRSHFIEWLTKNAPVYPHLAKWFGVHHKGDAELKIREEVEV